LGAFVALGAYLAVATAVFYGAPLYLKVNVSPVTMVLFFVGTAFLIAVFILLEGMTWFFGSSSSTPLVSAVALWVIFVVVVPVLSILPYLMMGGAINSADALATSNLVGLVSPTRVSTLLMSLGFIDSPGYYGSVFYGLNTYSIVGSAVAWVAGAVSLFFVVMKKKE
jgi:hypothetical protein